ncbi:MAG TPA: type II toxin-antitoxin system VapC family toxin [Thermodesulfovibrionales bacterium]|nr:type II toxin-antitoxin system VapC family toxin [Thermodesulfovibrionales bacterium]
MKRKSLLDSFALLAYLKQEDNYEKIERILLSHEIQVLMNDINIGETFYILARERGSEKAEYFLNVILPTLPITNISNALQEVIQAAKIKAQYPVSYADCFAIATALREGATIFTGDPDFKHVEKIVSIDWM